MWVLIFNTEPLVISVYHKVYSWYFQKFRRKLTVIDVIIQQGSEKICENLYFDFKVLLDKDVHQVTLNQKLCYNHNKKFEKLKGWNFLYY